MSSSLVSDLLATPNTLLSGTSLKHEGIDWSLFDRLLGIPGEASRQASPHIVTYEITDAVRPLSVTPNDPLFSGQWHLNGANGINVQSVWDDYRGAGITIGFIDDGTQYTHPDIDGNYNTAIDYDSYTRTNDGGPKSSSDKHGTTTAGVAAAEGDNALGVTGVAYQAAVSTYRINFNANLTDAMLADLFARQSQVDVTNNSWGFSGYFGDNFNSNFTATRDAITSLMDNGRGGLGNNIVFAAGNSRQSGDNTNYHSFQNSKYTITVAATDEGGKYTYFSTPGASLLVSAPGYNITSTDRTGSAGYVNGDYVSGLAGTSYAAPIVSGVIALMLDANPNLGWRDVQEILAYSARNSDAAHAGWQINGAGNWNGGGLHFSHDYGYGLVNAHDAVRLAETWQGQHTSANMLMADSGLLGVSSGIPDNNASGITRSFTFSGTNIDIDHVELSINLTHSWIGDLRVQLISPDGTVSTLVNRPGINPDKPSGYGSSADNVNFTLQSNAFWGEHADGTWTVRVIDLDSGYAGTFNNWDLRVFGDAVSANNTYVYTNEFHSYANGARTALTDTSGTDTINASAVTSNTVLHLAPGSDSTVDGVTLHLAAATLIENAYTGDGNDDVTGNAADNFIDAGRGDDMLTGDAGNDTLIGNLGSDTARYIGVFTDYVIHILNALTLTVQDTNSANGDEGTDTLSAIENLLFDGIRYIFTGSSVELYVTPPNLPPVANNDSASTAQEEAVTVNVLANDSDADSDTLHVSGITGAAAHGAVVINANNTLTYTPEEGFFGSDSFIYEVNDGQGHTATAQVNISVSQAQSLTLNGSWASNTLIGGAGADIINGNGGNDTIDGMGGNDNINGGSGNDLVHGGTGNDIIHGGSGNDTLYGDDGNDTIYTDGGTDRLIGGKGADTLVGHNSYRDTFIYEHLSDAGDLIQIFRKGQDTLDLRAVFDEIGYTGNNPIGDGYMSLQTAPGNDLQLFIDPDGAGAQGATLLLTLDNVNFTTLTAGTDYLIQ